jgi:selenocysteine-specific elongation factor
VLVAVERAGTRGCSLEALPVRLGIPPDEVERVVAALGQAAVARVGQRLLARRHLDQAMTTIERAVAEHHRRARLEPGMSKEQVRRAVSEPELADRALQELIQRGAVVAERTWVRLPSWTGELDPADRVRVDGVRNALRGAGFEGVRPADMASASGDVPTVALVEFVVRRGQAVRIGDRFLDSDIVQEAVAAVGEVIAATGQCGPAQIRERLGLTRKFSIPLLEWMDGQGYTVRQGDTRIAGPRLTGGSGTS